MYGGSSLISPSVVPTVVVRGHRGSRVLAARWSGVLDDMPMAVLALDTNPHCKCFFIHSYLIVTLFVKPALSADRHRNVIGILDDIFSWNRDLIHGQDLM